MVTCSPAIKKSQDTVVQQQHYHPPAACTDSEESPTCVLKGRDVGVPYANRSWDTSTLPLSCLKCCSCLTGRQPTPQSSRHLEK
ncbi:hypothetical protein E2C01_013914 [Portunus trituberculatus]|uniref:Uncharacterized protein n=1 Tax=Portunus trituberculatus TaxID=210409 RepID=A0A5B7DIR7_PORTR|nr:hypothetical protein [Portunus trituberculatus]